MRQLRHHQRHATDNTGIDSGMITFRCSHSVDAHAIANHKENVFGSPGKYREPECEGQKQKQTYFSEDILSNHLLSILLIKYVFQKVRNQVSSSSVQLRLKAKLSLYPQPWPPEGYI